MFGHQTNNDTNDLAGAVQHGSDAPADGSMPSLEPKTIAPTATSAPTVTDTASSYVITDLPGTAPTAADLGASNVPAPQAAAPQPVHTPAVTPSAPSAPAAPPVSPAHTTSSHANAGSLLDLKQSALHELSPLLGHLEQTPEEKFRTTMMMIQASDDHTMLQAAYEAAKAISDEKVRAQALLDVVNEINYFTQQTDAS